MGSDRLNRRSTKLPPPVILGLGRQMTVAFAGFVRRWLWMREELDLSLFNMRGRGARNSIRQVGPFFQFAFPSK